MSLSRGHADNLDVRDVKDDYIKAYIAEHEKFLQWGNEEMAAAVAKELLALGHDIKPAKAAPAKERAVDPDSLERAVEGDAPPKRRPAKTAE